MLKFKPPKSFAFQICEGNTSESEQNSFWENATINLGLHWMFFWKFSLYFVGRLASLLTSFWCCVVLSLVENFKSTNCDALTWNKNSYKTLCSFTLNFRHNAAKRYNKILYVANIFLTSCSCPSSLFYTPAKERLI